MGLARYLGHELAVEAHANQQWLVPCAASQCTIIVAATLTQPVAVTITAEQGQQRHG